MIIVVNKLNNQPGCTHIEVTLGYIIIMDYARLILVNWCTKTHQLKMLVTPCLDSTINQLDKFKQLDRLAQKIINSTN